MLKIAMIAKRLETAQQLWREYNSLTNPTS